MRIVVALGGNALGETPQKQKEMAILTVEKMLPLLRNNEVIFTHGNGPQVGLINNAFLLAHKENEKVSEMPFCECGALSQGYIGYHLQNALINVLNKHNIGKKVASIITQVVVDKNDQAFSNPTKPVGLYLSKEEAEKALYPTKEEANKRGYRRVVASPKPLKVLEEKIIDTIISTNNIVICCGGGGIPVIEGESGYIGVDAVIDKDLVSEVLATSLHADMLIILTAVDNVFLNYGKEDERALTEVDVNTLEKYVEEGHFKPGSMLPKVTAALNFVKNNNSAKAIITSIVNASEAINLQKGTIIYKK